MRLCFQEAKRSGFGLERKGMSLNNEGYLSKIGKTYMIRYGSCEGGFQEFS